MYYDHMHRLGWLLGGGAMLLFVVAVVIVVLAVARSVDARRPEPTAREVLDRRLARGEIDADEYRTRRDLLAGR
jgi:uncharacterized membrane protein